MDEPRERVKLFYSYSHKDEMLREELETHLKLLQRRGLIETWHDRMIGAGDEWEKRIDENLEAANIILLLVSADFIASDYCYENEMTRALERHETGEARVVPIIVREVNWKLAPFAKLEALPKDGMAVMKWPDRDSAWQNVSEGIERVIEEMKEEPDIIPTEWMPQSELEVVFKRCNDNRLMLFKIDGKRDDLLIAYKGYFMPYPSDLEQYYAYWGLTDAWYQARKVPLEHQGFREIWHQSFLDLTQQEIHQAVWLKRRKSNKRP